MSTFAENLIGVVLKDGWSIIEKISKHPDETGGNFSAQYIAQNDCGEKCFLKAIDIEKAILQSEAVGIGDDCRPSGGASDGRGDL